MSPMDIIKQFGPLGKQLESDAKKQDKNAVIADLQKFSNVYDQLIMAFSGSNQDVPKNAKKQFMLFQTAFKNGEIGYGAIESLGRSYQNYAKIYTQ